MLNKSSSLIEKLKCGYKPKKNQIIQLLELTDEEFQPVYELAKQICLQHTGGRVQLRSIIEFSNYCKRRCTYCGLRACGQSKTRYRMSDQEIFMVAKEACQAGYRTVILQSGEDPFYTTDLICNLIKEIKKLGVVVTLSIGERPLEDFLAFKQAGASRYLLKHETSDPQLYQKLHPCGTLEDRLACLREIKRLGFETGSGFMIGLPGQTLETLADDLLLLQDLGCGMAGIGPFVPCPETPLEKAKQGSALLSQRVVAIARIMMPSLLLPATTALSVIAPGVRNSMLDTGADVIMKTVTPNIYRQFYEIYPAPGVGTINIMEERKQLEALIYSLGRIPE